MAKSKKTNNAAKKKDLLKETSPMLNSISKLPVSKTFTGNFIALPDVFLPDTADVLMLSIGIGGENQTGSSNISIIEDPVFKPIVLEGSSENPIPLKPCNTLDEKTLLIISEITDTNKDPNNNVTSLSIILKAGANIVFKDQHNTTVKTDGDTARFIYKISCHVI
jgi:hypothetical protein